MSARHLAGLVVLASLLGGCSDLPDEALDAPEAEALRIASIRGVVPDAVDGEDLLLHVTYGVEKGQDAHEVGLDALAGIDPRAIPFDAWRYAFIDIYWDDHGASIHYNGADAPFASGDESVYQDSLTIWNDVSSSSFQFSYAGTTDRCPSLVQECGQQTFDGFNDTAWIALRGNPNTLAVTWTGTSTDEADQAYNTKNAWSIDDTSTSAIDFETVAIHENGHSLGLGHSEVEEAIMYAYYTGVQWQLHQDDIDGVSAKYPSGNGGGDPECVDDADCDDGDACNGAETCDNNGTCQSGTPVDCDDGDPCTIDSCLSDGTCAHDPDPACGDCDPVGAACDADADCCTGKCRGRPGGQTCK